MQLLVLPPTAVARLLNIRAFCDLPRCCTNNFSCPFRFHVLQFTEMVLRLLDTGAEAIEEVDGIDAIEAVQVPVKRFG